MNAPCCRSHTLSLSLWFGTFESNFFISNFGWILNIFTSLIFCSLSSELHYSDIECITADNIPSIYFFLTPLLFGLHQYLLESFWFFHFLLLPLCTSVSCCDIWICGWHGTSWPAIAADTDLSRLIFLIRQINIAKNSIFLLLLLLLLLLDVYIYSGTSSITYSAQSVDSNEWENVFFPQWLLLNQRLHSLLKQEMKINEDTDHNHCIERLELLPNSLRKLFIYCSSSLIFNFHSNIKRYNWTSHSLYICLCLQMMMPTV